MNAFGVGLPELASREGARIDQVLDAALVGAIALFAVCFGALLVIVALRRRRASADAGEGRAAQVRTVAAALAVFGLVDGTLFLHAVRDSQAVLGEAADPPGALHLEVEARQWGWDARYPGPDGAFGTPDDALSFDHIVLPEGVPVRVELASPDVIHGFNVPALRVKRDAVPGHVTSVTFTPTQPGSYDIACAQLCGVNHYKMRGELEVVPRARFDAWLAEASAQSSRAYDPADAAAHWAWPWSARR